MLLQLAKLSQTEENELLQNAIKPPPPYPEVTVHPVASTTPLQNSLLHGILTKVKLQKSIVVTEKIGNFLQVIFCSKNFYLYHMVLLLK